MPDGDTTARLLDEAETLIRTRGYNAFSYKDLAETIGIRTASIHYHFPSKSDLGVAVMNRYTQSLTHELTRLDRSNSSSLSKLKEFIKLYKRSESCSSMCLCGSLASDLMTLPSDLQAAVAEYLDISEKWVAKVIAAGVQDGEFDFSGKPRDAAATMVSSFQGGLILSRTRSGRPVTTAAIERVLLSSLGVA